MSIKDLFYKKTVALENQKSLTSSVESYELVEEINKKNSDFQPDIDFSDPNSFVKFGSAEEYYRASIKRVYEQYPYDGSESERLRFQNDSTYLDRWLYENKYPKSTGYAVFSANGWGSTTLIQSVYGQPADLEYIYSSGDIRTILLNQHTSSEDIGTDSIKNNFDSANVYDHNKNRTIPFRLNMTGGTTIQFWLKKDSFDASKTKKEVILDLWNGEQSGSDDYGRLILELCTTASNIPALRLSMASGSHSFLDQGISLSTYDATAFASSTWTHHTITLKSSNQKMSVDYYKNGLLDKSNEFDTGLTFYEIPGVINSYIGALQTSSVESTYWGGTYNQTFMKGAGKLAASMDDFRFWKKDLNAEYIYNTWFDSIGGGSNTDDSRNDLGVYYKFNEGIVGNSDFDSIVLDYSGRATNGSWTGYNTASRNTGSAFVSASVLPNELEDPIIRVDHPEVISLMNEMQVSGSRYDQTNPSKMYDTIPAWLRDEDTNSNIEYLIQIMSSYFDTLNVKIKELPRLKEKNYFSGSNPMPHSFIDRLLEDRGILVPNSFISADVMEKFWMRDHNNTKFEQDIETTKRLIYYNIYNNLDFILKSKGTEKSFRNLLRCYGVDDELIKLNVYTDNGTHRLIDRYKNTSLKTKFINFNNTSRFEASIINTTSSTNNASFIPSSVFTKLNAFTIEGDFVFPKKFKPNDKNFFVTSFITSSMFGYHQAKATATDYDWHADDYGNLQVYSVRDAVNSDRVKFVLTNYAGTIFQETDFYDGVYDNQRWNFSLCVSPQGYPNYGYLNLTHSSADFDYTATLYGVTHENENILHEFEISSKMNYELGSNALTGSKRFYVGAHKQNFFGTTLASTDLKVGSTRLWLDKLDNEVIKQHNIDPSNYGHDKIYGAVGVIAEEKQKDYLAGSDSLLFHWNFNQNSGSEANGTLIVEDFSSGSVATAATATIVIEDAGGVSHGDTFTLVDSSGTTTVYTVNGGVAQGSGGGSGGTATVGFAGVGGGVAGKTRAAFAITTAINGTTDANYSAASDGVDTVTITQGLVGSQGNRGNVDSIGSTTVSNFTGGQASLNRYGSMAIVRAKKLNRGYGFGFEDSGTDIAKNEFIFARKKELPEISFTDDNVIIMDDDKNFLIEDEDTTDNVFSLEKSMYQSVSEEMLNTVATMKEYANLFAKPVDYYRQEHKRLRVARQLFFNRVSEDLDFEKFTEYFKWIDSSLSYFIEQLKPLSTTFTDGVANVVESHIFERPKNPRKFPTIKTLASTEGSMRGVNELTYNWKVGHSPEYKKKAATATIITCVEAAIVDTKDFTLTNAEGITVVFNFSGGKNITTNHAPYDATSNITVDIGYAGLASSDAGATADEIITRINAGTGINIVATKVGDNVFLTQATPGIEGNTPITAPAGSSGLTLPASFAGGESEVNEHCEWKNTREERPESNRENLRNVVNSKTISFVKRLGTSAKTAYIAEGYAEATRRFSRPYKLDFDLSPTIHGGINYNQNKNRDFIYDVVRPHGTTTNIGIPVNVVVIGVGQGSDIETEKACKDADDPNLNKKFAFKMTVGKDSSGDGENPATASLSYAYRVKGHYASPFNLFSGSVTQGANRDVSGKYKSNVILTNLHSDTTYLSNDVPMQGPFTETWVGGHQSRHVKINRYNTASVSEGGVARLNHIDDEYSRPEAYRLLIGEHPDEAVQDGAIGIVGPDYGGPYPDTSRQMAVYYRGFRAKRPYNIQNIQGDGFRQGNYTRKYEYFNTVGRLENNSRFKKAHSSTGYEISGTFLPVALKADLPETTHPMTLVGIAASSRGNVWGTGESNRSNRFLEGQIVPEVKSSGSFQVTGSSKYDTLFVSGTLEATAFAKPSKHSYLSFKISGSSGLSGANLLQITASSVDKQIEVDVIGTGSLSDTDIVLPTYRKAFKARSSSEARSEDTSYSGLSNKEFSVSMWLNNTDANTTNNTYILFYESGALRHYARVGYDDVVMYYENNANAYDNLTFDTNTATVYGNQWIHLILIFDVEDLTDSSRAPRMFLNGNAVTASAGTYTAPGGTTPTIDKILLQLDNEVAIQDVTLWKTLLTGSESIAELYNSGSWKDPTTHPSASAINDYYKFGEEDYWHTIGYKAGDTLDDIGGSITRYISSSYGSGENSLTISNSHDQEFEFMKGKGTLSNAAVWNKLSSSLKTSFPAYNVSHLTGANDATFFMRKPSASVDTVSLTEVGTSFFNLLSSSGDPEFYTGSTKRSIEYLRAGSSVQKNLKICTGQQGSSSSGYQAVGTALTNRRALEITGGAGTPNTSSFVGNTSSYTPPNYSTVGSAQEAFSVSFWCHKNYDIKFLDNDGEEVWYLYPGANKVINQANSFDFFQYSGQGGSQVDDNHLVFTLFKNATTTPLIYVNGEAKSVTGWSSLGGTLNPITKLVMTNNRDTAGSEFPTDFVTWETSLNQEDAQILFNSGSWYDLRTHPSASHIHDWFLLGNEIAETTGSVLPSYIIVQPEIGTNTLTITSSGTNMTLIDGVPEVSKSPQLYFNDLTQSIKNYHNEITSSYIVTSSNTLLQLTASGGAFNPNFPLTWSKLGGSSYGTTVSIKSDFLRGAQDLNSVRDDGVQHNAFVQVGSTKFYIDANNTNAGGNYAKVGDHYYVYSSASNPSTFWTRLSGAIFSEFSNYNIATEVTSSTSSSLTTFVLTSVTSDNSQHRVLTKDAGNTFSNLVSVEGYYPAVFETGLFNVTEREGDFLTGSIRNKTVITSRFSAPGGIDVQTYGYLDAYAREYSVHNNLNYRNLSVRGSGSGESTTIRLNSHANTRDGLRTLYQRFMGRGGVDSIHETIDSSDYDLTASYHKIPRNTLVVPRSASNSVQIVEKNNNYNYQSIIPASDYNYSWVDSSLGNNYNVRSGTQKVFGYWPKDGMNKVNNVFDSAITFPTASDIVGV